jgi:hypothetical protein
MRVYLASTIAAVRIGAIAGLLTYCWSRST